MKIQREWFHSNNALLRTHHIHWIISSTKAVFCVGSWVLGPLQSSTWLVHVLNGFAMHHTIINIIDDNNNNSVQYLSGSLCIHCSRDMHKMLILTRVYLAFFRRIFIVYSFLCVSFSQLFEKHVYARRASSQSAHTANTCHILNILIFAETFLLIFHSQQRKKCVTYVYAVRWSCTIVRLLWFVSLFLLIIFTHTMRLQSKIID